MPLSRLTGAGAHLWRVWAEHAEDDPEAEAIVHWVAGEEPYRWRRAALLEAARQCGARLVEAGVGRGDVCALIVRHHREFYPLYMGAVSIGALPAVLAYPNPRLHPEKFRQGLIGMSRKSGLDWIVTEADLEPVVGELAMQSGGSIRGVIADSVWTSLCVGAAGPGGAKRDSAAGSAAATQNQLDPSQPALLQHSSGTTGLQKGVMLSHAAVLGHVARYGEAIALSESDKVVSWLPLYHDMGLIAAFHLPLASGIPLVQLDPFEWIAAPTILLDAVSAERGTLTWLPNFAFNVLTDRVIEEELDELRLDSLRMVINCSEAVRAESHERFIARFAPRGLDPNAVAACYAMAETTFAVSQTPPGRPPRVLEHGGRRRVSSGIPVAGCEVRVESGQLLVRSASLFSGYRNDPEKTAAVLGDDGWFRTGDVGFIDGGEVFVIGRQKDVIIVAGKNLYPEDIEDAVSSVPGILPGRVVAFANDDAELGTERVEVIAETAVDQPTEKARLERAVVEAAMAVDITIARVHLVPPRWLVKSSAGKPSRAENRRRLIAEQIGAPQEA
jgi:acyl-CoA synthetase (AMP-forming)/AMP-acid ligase II